MVRGELPSLTSCVLGPLTFGIVGIYSPSALGSQDVPSLLSPVVEKLTVNGVSCTCTTQRLGRVRARIESDWLPIPSRPLPMTPGSMVHSGRLLNLACSCPPCRSPCFLI